MSTQKYNLARAHNISLPSTKRKLNIDEATSALSSMGYRMGTVRHSLADKTSYWSVTTPTGSVVEVAANKLTDFVYGKIKNLNAQRYSDKLIRSLLPFEQEQIRNEGYKVYEVEICMPESGCNHYETVAAKDVRDAVRIGKAHAKGMKFNGVTKVNAKVLNNFFKSVSNQKAKSMNSETLDPNHLNNFISLFREKYLDDIAKHDHARVGAKAKFEDTRQILKAIQANMVKAERDFALLREKMKQGNWIACSAYCKTLAQIFAGGGGALDYLFDEFRAAGGKVISVRNSQEGAKAKFGEVENLLNMISDQMNSGNNDLAKTNLRKLAAKIGEIRHTRSEWDQFMTVAKSLGFTESQIGGFSRRGSKMSSNNTKSKFGFGEHFVIQGYIGDRCCNTKFAKSMEGAEHRAQVMLASIKSGKTNGKPVKVDIQARKAFESQGVIKTLHARTIAKAEFVTAPFYHRLADIKTKINASEVLLRESRKIGNFANCAETCQSISNLYREMRSVYIASENLNASRTGAKAAHAKVNIESHGPGSYYNSHFKEPRGMGYWAFIAPDGSIVYAPGKMSIPDAKSWLKQNATISGWYKVAP